MTKKLWYFLFILILATSCGGNDDEELIGNWTRVSDYDGLARSGASCFVIGNYAYVGLGYNGKTQGDSRNSDLWVYDVTRDAWKQVAALPDNIGNSRSHAASFVVGGKGYVCAGVSEINKNIEYLKDLVEYTPCSQPFSNDCTRTEGNYWTTKKSLPEDAGPRSEAIGIALDKKGYGYVGGGKIDGGSQLKDFYRYDPVADSWTQLTGIGGSKRSGALTFVANDKIYVCLGISNGYYLTDLQMYDDATDTWLKKEEMRNATDQSFDDKYSGMERANGVAFELNGKIYITLGISGSSNKSTWEYEPATDRWIQRTAFEGSARSDAVAFTLYDGTRQRAFVATGGSSTNRYDDVWEFKPTEEKNDNDNGNIY